MEYTEIVKKLITTEFSNSNEFYKERDKQLEKVQKQIEKYNEKIRRLEEEKQEIEKTKLQLQMF